MLLAQRWLLVLSVSACLLTFLYYLRHDSVNLRKIPSVLLDHHEGTVPKPKDTPHEQSPTKQYPSETENTQSDSPSAKEDGKTSDKSTHSSSTSDGSFRWSQVSQYYPVPSESMVPLPKGHADSLPKIQYTFPRESPDERDIRRERLAAVRSNFTHSWDAYKKNAWLKDEAGPLSRKSYDHFGGWAATLVDGLDTLWVMGLKKEFEEAVAAIEKIDFSNCALAELNVFETTIRYLGGLLGAYDISDGKYEVLLDKAKELGEMIYKAFDTPNRMPITRWDFKAAKGGARQRAPEGMLIAELGSLTLELTRLSQLAGDDKYYDAIKRVMDALASQQQETLLPGLFPIQVNARDQRFTEGDLFTLGGMVDSVYEYLPKMHLLFGGATDQYQTFYDNAMVPIEENLIFRPMTPDNADVLIAGQGIVNQAPKVVLEPEAQHLTCFVGGMVALGSKAFEQDKLSLARKLTDGCTWAYDIMPRGIMPEIMHVAPCEYTGNSECTWDDATWYEAVDTATASQRPTGAKQKISEHHLPPGVSAIDDTRYGLRPEAIESVFVLYRITGDKALQDKAWEMFNSIVAATTTEFGAAALSDCVDPEAKNGGKTDRMESFWFAETLKYFYLVFAEPEVVSLDEFVLNTEAHPLRYRERG